MSKKLIATKEEKENLESDKMSSKPIWKQNIATGEIEVNELERVLGWWELSGKTDKGSA